MIPNIRLYLELGAAAVLVMAFLLFVHHERSIGAANLQHSIAQATATAERNAAAQTAALQLKSDTAALEASHAQARLDDYVRDYPLPSVRVCVATRRPASVPEAGVAAGSVGTASAGPDPVQPVPDGAPGPDISRGLSAIVLAAGSMAVNLRELQAR